MVEGFHDLDMGHLEKYPEYNDMNRGEPDDEYNRLLEVKERATLDDNDSDNIERINYVQDLINRKFVETTFMDSEDGKTVTIKSM